MRQVLFIFIEAQRRAIRDAYFNAAFPDKQEMWKRAVNFQRDTTEADAPGVEYAKRPLSGLPFLFCTQLVLNAELASRDRFTDEPLGWLQWMAAAQAGDEAGRIMREHVTYFVFNGFVLKELTNEI